MLSFYHSVCINHVTIYECIFMSCSLDLFVYTCITATFFISITLKVVLNIYLLVLWIYPFGFSSFCISECQLVKFPQILKDYLIWNIHKFKRKCVRIIWKFPYIIIYSPQSNFVNCSSYIFNIIFPPLVQIPIQDNTIIVSYHTF